MPASSNRKGLLLAASIVENVHLDAIRARVLKTSTRKIAVSRTELMHLWPHEQLLPTDSEALELLRTETSRYNGSESVHKLTLPVLQQLAKALRLARFPAIIPPSELKRRVQDHLLFVRADDCILRQLDSHSELSTFLRGTELDAAYAARCLPPSTNTRHLQDWIRHFVEPMDAGFFACRLSHRSEA